MLTVSTGNRCRPIPGRPAVDYPVFGSFTLKGEADVDAYANAKITVTAYAIQADGFADAAAAWTAGNFR